jgi:hypothetical protein
VCSTIDLDEIVTEKLFFGTGATVDMKKDVSTDILGDKGAEKRL